MQLNILKMKQQAAVTWAIKFFDKFKLSGLRSGESKMAIISEISYLSINEYQQLCIYNWIVLLGWILFETYNTRLASKKRQLADTYVILYKRVEVTVIWLLSINTSRLYSLVRCTTNFLRTTNLSNWTFF